MYTLQVIFLLFIKNVLSQRGSFYEPIRNVRPLILLQDIGKAERLRYVEVELRDEIHFYGRGIKNMQVYFDGVIGFGSLLPACGNSYTSIPHIAIFWLPNTNGTVTYFEGSEEQLKKDRRLLAQDVNRAFGDNHIAPYEIVHALYITWNFMSNYENFNPQLNYNSFQAVIVTTLQNNQRTSYVIFIYRVISFFYVHALNGLDQPCQSSAVISLNDGTYNNRFILSTYFPYRRDWVILFTNEKNYQLLGRYCMRLNIRGGLQPVPPNINCAGNNPDPFCETVNWFHVMLKINKEFCLYREYGIYPYPLSCNRYVLCSARNGKRITQVRACPRGQNFNTILSSCDYAENIECNIPPRVRIITKASQKKMFSRPTPQPMLHGNKCTFIRNGVTTDPSSCASFIICSHTRSIRRDCQPGLLFDERLKRCEYPETVDCKSRPLPRAVHTT